MSNTIDLTGDGGVVKTIVRRAKPDAITPSDNLPLVDDPTLDTSAGAQHASASHLVLLEFMDTDPTLDTSAGAQHAIHYEGVLAETGEVFDSTHEDNTIFTFEVGQGTVIKAWDVALKTMKVGEVAKITCLPDYAYGSAGSPPDIPPNATLIFEVELVACRPRKGSSLGSASDERARLEELKKQRELAAANKEDEKKKREEAKAAASARIQAKLQAKKGKGKGKAK